MSKRGCPTIYTSTLAAQPSQAMHTCTLHQLQAGPPGSSISRSRKLADADSINKPWRVMPILERMPILKRMPMHRSTHWTQDRLVPLQPCLAMVPSRCLAAGP